MIQNNNVQNSNIFSLFPKYNLEQTTTVYNPKNENIPDSVEISKEKKPNSKAKKIFFGSTLASTILTAGIVSMFFAKGFHGSSFKTLSKLKDRLTLEIQETNHETTKDFVEKSTLYAKKGTQKTLDTLQGTSNFTAIKDWICDKIFRTNKVTTKFADTSTEKFTKIVNKTLGKKYDKVETKVKDLTSLLKHFNIANLENIDEAQKIKLVTIKGETKTLSEWVEILSKNTQKLENAYDEGFSLGARKLRDTKRTNLISDVSNKIEERFFKNKGMFKLDNFKNYVTEDVTSSAQKELKKDIVSARKKVTNNISTIHDTIKNQINKYSDIIKPDDKFSRDLIQTLKQKLEIFKNCSGENEAQLRNNVLDEVGNLIDEAVTTIKNNSQYNEQEQNLIIKQLSKIKSDFINTNSNSKGALEEIMTILKGLNAERIETTGKQLITDNEYKEFSKLSKQISKGLEKATTMEAEEYFLKRAEMKVGSAPTDVLSVLFPIGAGAFAIAQGDDKDEKISATLTTCIPLVGTFATFVYGTTKMLTGVKNLALSMTSGLILSKVGNYCDKLYKKYKHSGSVVLLAKQEYNNFLTDIKPNFEDEKK